MQLRKLDTGKGEEACTYRLLVPWLTAVKTRRVERTISALVLV